MSIYERPIQFRRLQLQLMTPERIASELEYLNENVRNIQHHSYSPICINYIRAIQEVDKLVGAGKSHFDPHRLEEAQREAEERLGTVGGVPRHKVVEPRVLKSHVLQEYFRLVPERYDDDDWDPELYGQIVKLAQKAMDEQAADRQRWENVAEMEEKRKREAEEKRRQEEKEARGE